MEIQREWWDMKAEKSVKKQKLGQKHLSLRKFFNVEEEIEEEQ